MAKPRTPGFKRTAVSGVYGGGNQKLRGIVLSEHAPNKNQARWVECPTYDVILLRDKSTLEGVPFFSSAFGTTELELHRLQTSSTTSIEKINRATAGGSEMPPFDDLEGAGVYVEFDDAGMPFIRTCYPRSLTHSSKIPNGRAVAQNDNAISPDSLDALIERVSSDPAVKDSLISEGSFSVLWRAEEKYVGEDERGVPNPPPIANTESKQAMWKHIWVVAWRAGFTNAYWSGPVVVATDGSIGAVMTAFEAAEVVDPNDSDDYIKIKQNAWRGGYRKGDADGKTELAIFPPPAVPDNSGATIPTDETTGDPADEDLSDYEQLAVLGKKCAFYREHRGVRIAIYDDGTFFLDCRSSTKPILIQGGDEGIKLTANGAVVDIASDSEDVVKTKSADIQLGPEGKVTEHVPTWEEVKKLHDIETDTLVSLNLVMGALETTLNAIAAGAGTAMLTAADYNTITVGNDLITNQLSILNDTPMSEVVSVARKAV